MATTPGFGHTRTLAHTIRAALAAGAFGLGAPAQAAVFTVTTAADNTTADGQCSLREAIQNASSQAQTNADCPAGSSPDAINFAASVSSITLGAGELPLSGNVTVTIDGSNGPGGSVTIDGGRTCPGGVCSGGVRVFNVAATTTATLQHLRIRNGYVSSGYGAGIYNKGNLTVDACVVQGNTTALGGGVGGGIADHLGDLVVKNSTVSGNTAILGAGIYVYGAAATATVGNSTITGNHATFNGGGIYSFTATTTISGSTISGNTADEDGGGAFVSGGTLSLTDSVVSGNNAAKHGGGMHILGIGPTITGTLFQGNWAGPFAGGGCMGGGLWAGVFTEAGPSIANSTFVDNYIKFDSVNVTGYGGAICNASAKITLKNVTMSGNTASLAQSGTLPGGGGIYNQPAFGSGTAHGKVYLTNTIISSSGTAGNCGGQVTPIISSGVTVGTFDQGGNIEDADTCSFTIAANSAKDTDPQLGPLQNNGGPTQTLRPLAGSWAIDFGIDATCSAAPVSGVDQRGIARPQGAHCDSGAVEARTYALGVLIVGSGTASAGGTPVPLSGGISGCTGGANCNATYLEDDIVTLTAVRANAFYFSGWSGAGCTDNGDTTASVLLGSPHTCTATFTAMSMSGSGSPVSPQFGAAITLSATVGGSSPSGTLDFSEGGNPLCTSGALVSGLGSCSVSNLGVGAHTIHASYAGDTKNGAKAVDFSVTVAKKTTTTSLLSSLNPSALGQSVTFTASVAGISPTGTVTFKDSSTVVCLNASMTGATATCPTSTLTAGSHAITAVYSGDGNNATSTSTPALTQVVNAKTATSTSISTACRTKFVENQSVALAAAVTGSDPGGSVAFKDGTTVFCAGAPLSAGDASCATPALMVQGAGTSFVYHATANYGGDSSNTSSASPQLALTVLKAADVIFRNDFEANPVGCPTR